MSAATIAAMTACIIDDERRRRQGDGSYYAPGMGDVGMGIIIGLGIITIGVLIGVLINT